MYGDHSRGHQPDRKRGRDYRRVLLQMGRPLLDSDVASLVDAVLDEVRTSTRGASGPAGSPDLGFLITPGRLLALFAEAHERLAPIGTPNVWLDYRHRFAGRYPALHVASPVGASGVRLPLLQPLDDATAAARAALWARVETATTVFVNGIAVSLSPDPTGAPRSYGFDLGSQTLDPLEVTVAAGGEVWFFLLEQHQAAGTAPAFWVAPGSYHVDGLVAKAPAGGRFPSVTFPEEAGYPWAGTTTVAPPLGGLVAANGIAPGTRLVAYLENWERHITAVEDPGIREEALGSSDTSTRTQLLGQVKVATVDPGVPSGTAAVGAVREAFGSITSPRGGSPCRCPRACPAAPPARCRTPAVTQGPTTGSTGWRCIAVVTSPRCS
jgi:hypothetical protein